MSSSDPVKQFESLLSNSEFLFVVCEFSRIHISTSSTFMSSFRRHFLSINSLNTDYRGHWCPFCLSYLRDFSSLSPAITAAHGTPLTVTAEPEINLSATRSATGYTGNAIVDPLQFLAKELKRRGLLDVAITEKKGYEYGVAQPAVLVIKKDGTVLESWAILPKMVRLSSHLPSLKYLLRLF